mgnify:CR=1 FL=1
MGQNSKDFVRQTCQLDDTLWYSESLTRKLRRTLILIIRRLKLIAKGIGIEKKSPECSSSNSQRRMVGILDAGSRVRVRSAAEIRTRLDKMGRTGGCKFIDPMVRYCGQELRILRRVNQFFDETQRKMLKTNKLVILEDCHCDGTQSNVTSGCDRMCYYFWRVEWLESLEDKEGHLDKICSKQVSRKN